MADTLKDLLDIFEQLIKKSIVLYCIEEDYFSGTGYFSILLGFKDLYIHYAKLKRLNGFQKAKADGKVGRKKKTAETVLAIKLYNLKAFSINEIEEMSGCSSSTLYRALKDLKKLSS